MDSLWIWLCISNEPEGARMLADNEVGMTDVAGYRQGELCNTNATKSNERALTKLAAINHQNHFKP